MNFSKEFNPTPISKLFVIILLSFSLVTNTNDTYALLTTSFIAVFFALNNKKKTALKVLVFYGIVFFLYINLHEIDIVIIKEYIFIFIVILKLFFLPFLAGKFLIDTSDVSSLIVSFETLKLPRFLVVPLAVVFRYAPAYREDKKNIKNAMKMRGISFKNPIKYLEYVNVPLLISAVNIADDISKAAETKCISDPSPKIRYKEVKFTVADIVFVLGIIILNIWGRIYA